eukprot:Filipodium_phascolosomae@DN2199_c0_g1_i1.p1
MLCWNCQTEPTKYRCPRCGTRTCSLQCCKSHKSKTSCSGIRSNSSHVPSAEYTDLHLSRDFRFLEDVVRNIDSSARVVHSIQGKGKNAKLRQLMRGLVEACRQRGTKLILGPIALSASQENTSRIKIDRKRKASNQEGRCDPKIHWRVKWHFMDSSPSLVYTDTAVSEERNLGELVMRFIDNTWPANSS